MKDTAIRTPYDGFRDPNWGLDCGTEGGAKQSMREECDINNIVATYAQTGLLTPVNVRPPMFIDVSGVEDYRQALDMVIAADKLFMQLPAKTRALFDNDPAVFLDFSADPQNADELRDLGLLPKRAAEEAPEPEPKEEPPASEETPPED